MFMRYDYLAEFLVVAEEGSIARAAEKLSLSPSAISKHLAALESYLGAELLVRSRHCHELTEAGRAVVETGAGLLDIGERVQVAARARRALKVCSLFDSVSCYRLITQGIRRFESEGEGRPRVRVDQSMLDGNAFAALEAGEVDVVAYNAAISSAAAAPFESVFVMSMHYLAVLPAGHPLARRESVHILDLKDCQFAHLVGGSRLLDHIWLSIKRECYENGFSPRTRVHKIFMPADGAFVDLEPDEAYLLPEDSVSVASLRENEDYACVPVEGMEHPLCLCYRPDDGMAGLFAAEVVRAARG